MKVTTERIDKHKLTLELEIPESEVAKALDKAYHKLANKVNVPGFRKGKVPRKVLEMRIGKEALKEEALEIVFPEAYEKAIAQEKVEPITRPEVEVVSYEEDKPLVIKATVVIKPEVELGEYKGLEMIREQAKVDTEQVDKQLEQLRSRHAKMVVKEDAALEKGDFAIIDFLGTMDGVPFKGGDGKGYPLEVGSNTFIPGFEEQLIGLKAGEEKDVEVTFPENYHAEDLAGKPAVFHVKINDVKHKELPDLDDDFAKEVSDFDTLEELKADMKNKLQKMAEEQAEHIYRSAVVQKAVNNAKVDIPEVLVDQKLDDIIYNLKLNLESRGMNFDQYLELTKTTLASVRDKYRERALEETKTDLVLEAIARSEGFQVEQDDLEQEIADIAATYGVTPEEVKKVILEQGNINGLVLKALYRKTSAFIVEHAVEKEAAEPKAEGKKAE